ncbi:MAG: transporter substrate-binding domain-containing protein [Synechococcales bacterium]|nr:transporter substrate-binding domain-containing protein [Synechococcales bacterium]
MSCPKWLSRSRSNFLGLPQLWSPQLWRTPFLRRIFSPQGWRGKWFPLALLLGWAVAIGWGQIAAISADLPPLQQRGYVTIAIQDQSYPLSFRDAQGQRTGWEIEIAERLAQELVGQPHAARFQVVRNLDRIPAVAEGRVDLAIARVSATAARRRLVDFSLPYYWDGTGLITQRSDWRSISDFRRGRIAVLVHSSTFYTLQYSLPQAQLSFVTSYAEAVQQLNAGIIDAFAADQSLLSGWQRQDARYRLLPFQLSIEPLAIVLPKGLQHAELRYRVNQILQQWRREEWLKERAAVWGLPWAIVERN